MVAGITQYTPLNKIKVMKGGEYVSANPLTANFSADDFNITADELQKRMDIALTKILNVNERWHAKDAAQTGQNGLIRLIEFDGDDINIGQDSLTVPRSFKVRNGMASRVLEINDTDGKLRCGGPSVRIVFDETGLTGSRNITFNNVAGKLYPATNIKPVETGLTAVREQYYPDRNTKLLGFYDAIPMGDTDYQFGSIVGGDMSNIWGEGILENLTTYGTFKGQGTTNSAGAYRFAGTGTTIDTRAGERSTSPITRRIVSPILWARIHIFPDANIDTRWFCGFSDATDIPVNTDTPLDNLSGFGFVIDDAGSGNNSLEFHRNNGAAASTQNTIRSSTSGLGIWTDVFAYFYMECDERNDQFKTKVWFGTADGSPIGTPTHEHTFDFTGAPAAGTQLRYHNVINNESAIDEYLNIAEVHMLNRPTLDNTSNPW